MKDVLDSIRKHLPIIIHYGHAVILSVGTILFGMLLIINNPSNVIERVELFPHQASLYFGTVMMILGLLKLVTVFKPNNRIKKWSLIGITLLWLIITWAYLVNQTQNTGSVMAATLSASCYVELWRGDFRDE